MGCGTSLPSEEKTHVRRNSNKRYIPRPILKTPRPPNLPDAIMNSPRVKSLESQPFPS